MQRVIYCITYLVCYAGISQNSDILHGKIVENTLQLDAINILNLTKGLGTISDKSGFFQIRANVGDTIVFSSIRHQQKNHIVKEKDIKLANLEVVLEVRINELDEVLVSQYNLSGKIKEDINEIETYEDNLPSLNAKDLDLTPYIHEKGSKTIKNKVIVDEMDATPVNIIAVGRMIASLFEKKENKVLKEIVVPKISDFYKSNFLINTLKIPETEVYNFLDFLNDQSETKKILKSGNELKVLEFLMDQSIIFSTKYIEQY